MNKETSDKLIDSMMGGLTKVHKASFEAIQKETGLDLTFAEYLQDYAEDVTVDFLEVFRFRYTAGLAKLSESLPDNSPNKK